MAVAGGPGILLLPCLFYEAWTVKYPESPPAVPQPPGAILTINYSGELRGFRTQQVLPPILQYLGNIATTYSSDKPPYLNNVEDYNVFIRKLNIATQNALPPHNFAGFYWFIFFIFLIPFIICCWFAAEQAPSALGGLIAFAILIVIWIAVVP